MSSPKPSATILIIDDEVQIRRLLTILVEGHGYRVLEAETGALGLTEAATRRPDIILLDLGLPDMDGLALLARIREWSKVPIIVLTVRDGEDQKVAALDAGADDYVTKPFSASELLARIRVALRRAQADLQPSVFSAGNLQVDLASRQILKNGKEIHLTSTEYTLLRLLVLHAGRVLTHGHLMREIWGPKSLDQTHYLRVYIKRLREKLEDHPAQPSLITTEPGVGYRFAPEV